ncbi:glycosyltransferase family 2 protein [Phycicoccus sp. CSK15P-2]|uniref:glycosyltransferase family 2 protein n=1 Tax=Phycicoccus sp. CSK15P-2 TaxID=2807627 RepID=UPI0019524499|nr:glycosyltransferase family 2 protein [Phycicoccus sp. CSK15P-2]MBM6405942.1 glycosyltransferase family 2 protein [Phycicoccus sp. CSK15P-2]
MTPGAGAVAPHVTAVLVSRRDPAGVAEVLDAVLAQTLAPDTVLVLDRTAGRTTPAPGGDGELTLDDLVAPVAERHRVPVTVLPTDDRLSARTAVLRAVVAREPSEDAHDLVWLLPVGTAPEPGCLVRLVDAWRRSPSTGVVGPKHVDTDAPHRLRALSIRTTRGGRLLSRPAPGEPDQGQYDTTTDVLAVPFAASLVERDLLLALRGWETSFGDVAADLDLGWRAHGLGRRVVVVPAARTRSGPGVAVCTATTSARRRAARRVALARAPWWSAPFLALWVAVTSVVASVGLLFLKRPRGALAELTALSSLDPVRGLSARWRTRQRSAVRRRDLGMLFAPRRSVLTAWGDAVHHALVPPQAPIGNEASDLNPRSWVGKVLRHPGVVAVVASLAVAVAAGRTLGLDVVTRLGQGLDGGELTGTRADSSALWHAWRDGWTGAGLGGPDPTGPSGALLAAPAWLVAHLPFVPAPQSPAGLVAGLLVLLAMPSAALSAYLALRVAAGRPWVRALGAVAWACSPPAAAAVAEGRLGATVALVLLPGVAAGLWLMAVRRSTATSAFATALAVTVLGAFAPVLAASAAALSLVVAVLRRGARVHGLVSALVPLGLLAPWAVAAGDQRWPVLLAGVGLAEWGGPVPEAWRVVLLDAGGPVGPAGWAGAALVAGALLSLGTGRAWRGAPGVLAVATPFLLVPALLAPQVRLGVVPPGLEAAGEAVRPWAGTFLLPVVLVLVLALVRALDTVPTSGPTRGATVTRRAALVGGSLAVVVTVGGVALAGLGSALRPWSDPRPAVSVDQASGAFATRALFVSPGDAGAAYRFVGRESASLVRGLPTGTEADAALADDVTALLAAAPGSEALIDATAADLLAIRGQQVPEVVRRLDATDGLQRISPRDGWMLWRLSPVDDRAEALVASPRLRLETSGESRLVPTTGAHGATRTRITVPEDARLVVAEPAAWSRYAAVTVDGRVVRAEPDAAVPTYRLPAGQVTLSVQVRDPRRWEHRGQVLGLALLAFLAVPFGRRETRVTR